MINEHFLLHILHCVRHEKEACVNNLASSYQKKLKFAKITFMHIIILRITHDELLSVFFS